MKVENNDFGVLLGGSVTSLKKWCEASALAQAHAATEFVRGQTWVAAKAFATAANPTISHFVSVLAMGVPEKADAARELLWLHLGEVVLGAWVAAATSTEVGIAMGLAAELRHWLLDLRSAGLVTSSLDIREIRPPRVKTARPIDPKVAAYVANAALEESAQEDRQDGYHRKVDQLCSLMGISAADLARLLGVTREAVRLWQGGNPIGEERWAAIDSLYDVVQRLLVFFKPDRLPAVLRRPIPALSNKSPLRLLEQHRADDLLGLYDRVFNYGVTA